MVLEGGVYLILDNSYHRGVSLWSVSGSPMSWRFLNAENSRLLSICLTEITLTIFFTKKTIKIRKLAELTPIREVSMTIQDTAALISSSPGSYYISTMMLTTRVQVKIAKARSRSMFLKEQRYLLKFSLNSTWYSGEMIDLQYRQLILGSSSMCFPLRICRKHFGWKWTLHWQ